MIGTTGGSGSGVALIGAKPRRGRRRAATKKTAANGSARMACKKPSDRSHHGALLFFASGVLSGPLATHHYLNCDGPWLRSMTAHASAGLDLI